jgi:LEA14-like dessication related protein
MNLTGRASPLLLLLLAAVACLRVRQPLEAPLAELGDAEVVAEADGALRFDVTLRVTNRDPEALELRAFDWELASEGLAAARGRVEQVVALPARSVTEVPLSLRVPPGAAWRLGETGAVALSGTLHCFTRRGAVAGTMRGGLFWGASTGSAE